MRPSHRHEPGVGLVGIGRARFGRIYGREDRAKRALVERMWRGLALAPRRKQDGPGLAQVSIPSARGNGRPRPAASHPTRCWSSGMGRPCRMDNPGDDLSSWPFVPGPDCLFRRGADLAATSAAQADDYMLAAFYAGQDVLPPAMRAGLQLSRDSDQGGLLFSLIVAHGRASVW